MGIDLRNTAIRYLSNLKGWRTGRKIMVIESDDWGSIRMPSREVYHKCMAAGYPVDKTVYERYDTLLSRDDLELLFGLLLRFRDKNGHYPVITANCVVANPDFEKIEKDYFRHYHFELITETFRHYPAHSGNFERWLKAMDNGLFYPQFHAREHLNVSLFMNALRNGNEDILFAFGQRMPGCVSKNYNAQGNLYVEAMNYQPLGDKQEKLDIYMEGLDIFESLFGYRSKTIIPPNYLWSQEFDEPALKKGVIAFQGNRKMREPIGRDMQRFHPHYLGMRNQLGQIYLVRNVWFEPSIFRTGGHFAVDRCLSDMAIAFRMKKPAIIGSHRLNYAGFIDVENRDRTLRMMEELFRRALKRWPDLEFMNSEQLALLIAGNQ